MYPSSLFRACTASQHKRVSIHVLPSTSILEVPTDQPKYSRRSHAQMPLKRHRQCLDPCRDFYVNVTVRDQLAERNICGVKSRFLWKKYASWWSRLHRPSFLWSQGVMMIVHNIFNKVVGPLIEVQCNPLTTITKIPNFSRLTDYSCIWGRNWLFLA